MTVDLLPRDPAAPAPAPRRRLAAALDRLPVPLRVAAPWLRRSNERENRDGWARLSAAAERPRYDAVRCLTERYARQGRVLDVGCSQGILQEGLRYGVYEGVDTCAAAVRLARTREDARTRFVVADGAAYRPLLAPDAVVLTEVLYYLPDPVRSAEHYAALLAPGGALVVSASARSWTSTRLLRRLAGRLEEVEHWVVTSRDLAWRVVVLQPRPVQAAPLSPADRPAAAGAGAR